MSQYIPNPPHPKNIPGDFYVEDGCCTMCGVPFAAAPELFSEGKDEDGYEYYYVSRQPETAAEIDQMIDALSCSELACIHYQGRDPQIIERLVQIGKIVGYNFLTEK